MGKDWGCFFYDDMRRMTEAMEQELRSVQCDTCGGWFDYERETREYQGLLLCDACYAAGKEAIREYREKTEYVPDTSKVR